MEYNKDFFKRILEASHDEIWVCDKNGSTIYCNKAFEDNYGIKRDNILGKTAMFLSESGYSNQTPIPLVLKSKCKISMEQKTKTGKSLIITATPILDINNNIEFIVENCRDISELNNIKNKLASTEKEIEKYKDTINYLSKSTNLTYNDTTIKGDKMLSILEIANNVAKTDVSVLLLGESGCGKSTLAKYIHSKSNRSSGPFITINCSTISPHLLESELFGYTPGSFTGANTKGKIGLVELANGGTLFLDEIGDIPQNLQSKFLQLIQDRTFTPVGGLRSKKIDIRIISATNIDLLESVNNRKFREDLYYRINVIELKIPSLRDRREDLSELIFYFLNKYSTLYNLNKNISNDVIETLLLYDYPGNIRQLENIIQNILVTSTSNTITKHNLPSYLVKDIDLPSHTSSSSFDELIENYEKHIILNAYNKYKSSYKVASALNLSQTKASRLIRKYIVSK